MVDDGSFFYVQPPEVEVVEVDGPDAGTDLLEADELAKGIDRGEDLYAEAGVF